MKTSTGDMRKPSSDDLFEQEFRTEQRNKYIVGILALVLFAAVAMGILYYFGFMSGVAW